MKTTHSKINLVVPTIFIAALFIGLTLNSPLGYTSLATVPESSLIDEKDIEKLEEGLEDTEDELRKWDEEDLPDAEPPFNPWERPIYI